MSKIKIDKNELSSIISQLTTTRDGLSSALSNAVSSVPKKVNLSSFPFTYTDRVKEAVWNEEEAKYVDTYKTVTKYRYQNEGRRFNSAIASINPQLQNVTDGLKYLDNVINALSDIQSAVNEFEETDYAGRLAAFSFDFNWKNPSSTPTIDSLDKDTITNIALENGWIEAEEDFNEDDYYDLLSYLMNIVGVEKFEDLTTTEDVISSLEDFFGDENGEDEDLDEEKKNDEDNESEVSEETEETENSEIELGSSSEDNGFGDTDKKIDVNENEQQEIRNDNSFSQNINDKVVVKNNTIADAGETKKDKVLVTQPNSASQNIYQSSEDIKEQSNKVVAKDGNHESISKPHDEKNEEKFNNKHNANFQPKDEKDVSSMDKGNTDSKVDFSINVPKNDANVDAGVDDGLKNNESISNSKNDNFDLPKINDDFNKTEVSNGADSTITDGASDDKVVSSAVAGALGIGSLLGGGTDVPTILPGSSDSVIGDFNYTNLPNNETIMSNGSVTYPNNNIDNNTNYNNSNNYDNYNSVANKSSDSNEGVLGKGKSSSNVSTVNKENKTNNAADGSVQSGALGEASYVEMLAKEEKKYKIATATSISASLLMLGFKYIGVIGWLTLLLLIAAIVLVYTTYRARHKKKKKKLEALIKIEREKSIFEREKEKNMSLEEAANAEIVEEPSGDLEENLNLQEESTESHDIQKEEVQIQEIEQNLPKLPEQKEFQMAEEVIYGEMPQKDTEIEVNVESDKN